MDESVSPSTVSQLKRALGNDHMPLQEALRQALELACENRNLKIALHDAVVRAGEVPVSAKRHIRDDELRYARIRMNHLSR